MGTETQRSRPSSKPGPVNNLVIYKPKAGKEKELFSLIEKHYPALKPTGLVTAEPAKIWKAYDIRKNETSFVEMFTWKDEKSAELAHQTPAVMAVWEPMGNVLEDMTILQVERVGG